jgi:predicted RNA methylase
MNAIFPDAVRFVSEQVPQEIPITDSIYRSLFIRTKAKGFNSQKLKLTNIGVYSMAPPLYTTRLYKLIISLFQADGYTGNQLENIVVTDAMANCGGSTIMFALHFRKTNAVEIVPLHYDILRNNLTQYNLLNRVNTICSDYMDVMFSLKQDVVFFDPPWGGKSYCEKDVMSLTMNNINIVRVIKAILPKTKYVLLRIPYNYRLADLNDLDVPANRISHHVLLASRNPKWRFIVVVIRGEL